MAWLQGLPDVDVLKGSDLDWIKAGKASGDYLNDYNEAYEQVVPNDLMVTMVEPGLYMDWRVSIILDQLMNRLLTTIYVRLHRCGHV